MLCEEIILQWFLSRNDVISYLFVARHTGVPRPDDASVCRRTCAGSVSVSPGVCCCSSSYSLKQSEDLPINIKVTHEKAGHGFGDRAAAGRLLTVQMLLLQLRKLT